MVYIASVGNVTNQGKELVQPLMQPGSKVGPFLRTKPQQVPGLVRLKHNVALPFEILPATVAKRLAVPSAAITRAVYIVSDEATSMVLISPMSPIWPSTLPKGCQEPSPNRMVCHRRPSVLTTQT